MSPSWAGITKFVIARPRMSLITRGVIISRVASGIRAYRESLGISQLALAKALGVTQAYVSQLEAGVRPVTRQVAERLAALPEARRLPPTVFPVEGSGPDAADADVAADLAALGYPGFEPRDRLRPRNPAAVIMSVIGRRQVAPAVMAAIPWVLLHFPDLDTGWLVSQARLNNLQNRLGFLTDLALQIQEAAHLVPLRAELESSRLAKEDTLARELTPSERQFFEEHRTAAARHWNLLTGLTKDTLPHVGANAR